MQIQEVPSIAQSSDSQPSCTPLPWVSEGSPVHSTSSVNTRRDASSFAACGGGHSQSWAQWMSDEEGLVREGFLEEVDHPAARQAVRMLIKVYTEP